MVRPHWLRYNVHAFFWPNVERQWLDRVIVYGGTA
jgi:hypothetical protein